MQSSETPRTPAKAEKYSRVKHHGKPVRGLWKRGGRFYARLTLEDEEGRKAVSWIHLEKAGTVPQAVEALNAKKVERAKNVLKAKPAAPKLDVYLKKHLKRLEHAGKKPDTIVTETGHLNRWAAEIGHLRLDRITPAHIRDVMHKRIQEGRAPRTVNISLVALRSVFKEARRDGFLQRPLATEDVDWFKVTTKRRQLVTPEEIDHLLTHASESKNGEKFTAYIRFLQYTGAREQEALKVRWKDVDVENEQVTIGAEGDTKNRSGRVVDMSEKLKAHLEAMRERSGKVSDWLFPSPQRGDKDIAAKSFRESLKIVRKAAGMPAFGFHDCRHHFISYAVMSGIDYMTVAAWVGHKDEGVLIGKVYGHLANEHRQAMARKMNFGTPQIVEAGDQPAAGQGSA